MKKSIIIISLIAICYPGIRIGYDISKEGEMSFLSQKSSSDIDSGFLIAYDRGNLGLDYGMEFIFSTELENSVEEVSIYSIYGMYSVLLNQDMIGFFKLGYSQFDYDFNGTLQAVENYYGLDNYDIDVSGGIMYGFGINFEQFQFSYTIHTGELDVYVSNDGAHDSAEGDFDVTRITLSYLLNTFF